MTHLADVLAQVCLRSDWRRVAQLYSQLSSISSDARLAGDALPGEIPSALAEALAHTFASYDGSESSYIDDLLLLFAAVEGLDPRDPATFRFLYFDIRLDRFDGYRLQIDGRRRPKPFEAAVETVRRIDDLNQIQGVIESAKGVVTTGVLGGSLSYGRFYNTCGGIGKPSDTDLLVLISDYDQLSIIGHALHNLEFVDTASAELLTRRIEFFRQHRRDYPRCVFRHKLKLWEDHAHQYASQYQVPSGHYLLGLQVVSPEEFNYLTLSDMTIVGGGEGTSSTLERRIHEYRDDPPPKETEEGRSFAGDSRSTALPSEAVVDGCVTYGLVCEIADDRFYPGVHLNLILPRFEVRWESSSMRLRLTFLNLRWKLLARLEDEKKRHGGHLRLSQSHTRSAVFSPHVLRAVDYHGQ